MATYKEINNYFKQKFNIDLNRTLLSKWVKENKFSAEKKENGKYDYNLEEFCFFINSEEFILKTKAKKEKPEDYIGRIQGKLLIKSIVPKNEYKNNYQGTMMYCDCLGCGEKDVQIRFSYLTNNGNYFQESCGCGRKVKAFLSSCREGITEDFLDYFLKDFEKFLFIHRMLIRTTDGYYVKCPIEEYQKTILYFWNDIQFNKIYNFWLSKKNISKTTFYDWAKPSLDHIVPKSRGGKDSLDNLQTLTVFENLAKRDMTWDEWINFKKETNTTSEYFVEKIL